MKTIISLLIFIVSCSSSQVGNPAGIGSKPNFADLIPKSDYVIYSDCATVPTLYAALHMQTHTIESYIFMGRTGTLDIQEFPPHVSSVANVEEMRKKIAELNRNDPQATFTLYMNDLRVAKLFTYFYSQGISEDRVTAVMLSDGVGTYNEWKKVFGGTKGWNTWKNAQDTYKKALNNPKDLNIDYFWTKPNFGVFLTAPATANNTSIWMQWPELLIADNQDFKNYLEQNGSRYYKVDPLEYYQSLTDMQKQGVIRLFGLNKKWSMNEEGGTLNDQTIEEALRASPKPNIMLTATNPFGDKTDGLIAKAKAKYGDRYDYFFKGHPGDRTKPADTSIIVFPFPLPIEPILWLYGKNIAVMGGYESSLYLNAPKEIKKFFYLKSGSDITIAPLDIMYQQGLLGEVEFIQ
ncbi:MAG: hypothetical protein ACRCWI_04775 [Brevinema sp.]